MALKILNGIDVIGSMNIAATDVPSLDASKITSGTINASRIPSLDASKITSGTINASRIPSIDASKINSGAFSASRLPDLSGTYALASHNHDSAYASISHNHDGVYARASHTHSYLPLSGGTLTGDLTTSGNIKGANLQISSTTPTIYFNGTSDGGDYAGSDMAIKATPEGLDFYEPEDGNKVHFQILDDAGVNAPYGYKWNGQSLDARYAAAAHTHSYNNLTGIPNTFTPSAHTHSITDVDGLQTALDGKAAASHTHNYDNYGSWNLKTNGTQRTTVGSGGTLDIKAGTNVSVSYGAGGVVTINSTDTNTDTNNYVSSAAFNTTNGVLTLNRSGLSAVTVDLDGRYQLAGTYNTIIGTDSDINTSGSTIIDNIYVTDGVITSMGTRTLTAADLGIVKPEPPGFVAANIVGETIEVVFDKSGTAGVDSYQVWSSVAGGSYGLIANIPTQDIALTMTAIDAVFSVSGVQAYRVYAIKNGIYSDPAEGSVTYNASGIDVVNMSVVNLNTAYYIQYDMPDSRFIDHVEIYMDAETSSGSLSRTGASLIYSGNNTSYMYQIGAADLDKFHQFWVEVVES